MPDRGRRAEFFRKVPGAHVREEWAAGLPGEATVAKLVRESAGLMFADLREVIHVASDGPFGWARFRSTQVDEGEAQCG